MSAPLREQLGQALHKDSGDFYAWDQLASSSRERWYTRADRIIAAVPLIGAAEDMRMTIATIAKTHSEVGAEIARAFIAKATPK